MFLIKYLFGERKTPSEKRTEILRTLNRAKQSIIYEINEKEKEERSIFYKLKKASENDIHGICKSKAKRLHGVRTTIRRMHMLLERFETLYDYTKLSEVNNNVIDNLIGVTNSVHTYNTNYNIEGLTTLLQEFEEEILSMNNKEKIVGEVLDKSFLSKNENEEEVMKSIMEEVSSSNKPEGSSTKTDILERLERLNQ